MCEYIQFFKNQNLKESITIFQLRFNSSHQIISKIKKIEEFTRFRPRPFKPFKLVQIQRLCTILDFFTRVGVEYNFCPISPVQPGLARSSSAIQHFFHTLVQPFKSDQFYKVGIFLALVFLLLLFLHSSCNGLTTI